MTLKLAILSDVHVDHNLGYHTMPADADVLVLAGDICSKVNNDADDLRRYARDHYECVIEVPGNHEYYGTHYHHENIHDGNYHYVNNDFVTFKGQRFLCSTLWTHIPPMYIGFATVWEDMKCIEGMTPSVYNELHAESRLFLELNVKDSDIIVTHHMPYARCIQRRFSGRLSNIFFNANMDIYPKVWIHGHTHCSHQFTHNGTLVICNPHGYHDENIHFDPRLTLCI